MKKTVITIAFCLATSFAIAAPERDSGKGKGGKGGAQGADPAKRAEMAIKKLDTDKSGDISLEEWKASPMAKKEEAKAVKMFTAKDKDDSGTLTKEELMAKVGKGGAGGGGKKKPAGE